MNTVILILFAVPLISLACGMWFGRNAPHRPEYNLIGQ
jgi:hypothetical protein